jgi:hypothetical protein
MDFDIRKRNENENLKFGDNEDGTTYIQVRDTSKGQNLLNNKYAASDMENGITSYYGFLSIDGSWYIMKKTVNSIRYFKGDSDYLTNWNNRTTLSYDYYDVIFG